MKATVTMRDIAVKGFSERRKHSRDEDHHECHTPYPKLESVLCRDRAGATGRANLIRNLYRRDCPVGDAGHDDRPSGGGVCRFVPLYPLVIVALHRAGREWEMG